MTEPLHRAAERWHYVLRCVGFLLLGAMVAVAKPAAADTQRYSVVIGNNNGLASDLQLRFAESDAGRVADLLGELGQVPAENQIVLRGKSAREVMNALIATNERIRVETSRGNQTMLIVYYSGHGDNESFHIAGTRLALREVEGVVRGSAANVRLMIVDACQSGAVTRVKGGRPAPPIVLAPNFEANEGLVVLTASASGEDAQESDELRGSFFTHYLLSGLRGGADENQDQRVTVAEAFAYTRTQTIVATSRTASGPQHPTFHYDLRGRSDVMLADLRGGGTRGELVVPAQGAWLILRDGIEVTAEVPRAATHRSLHLAPGTYAVRGRTKDALLEGQLAVRARAISRVLPEQLRRTAYAQFVRKGGRANAGVHGLQIGLVGASPVAEGLPKCVGPGVGWSLAKPAFTLSSRIGGCTQNAANQFVVARMETLLPSVRVTRAWDVGRLSMHLGVALGASLMRQRYSTPGVAPTRLSAAGNIAAVVAVDVNLGRSYITADVGAATHLVRIGTTAEAATRQVRGGVHAAVLWGVWL